MSKEPVMAVAVVIALILGVAGVAVDADTLYNVLAPLLVLIGGFTARAKVTPV